MKTSTSEERIALSFAEANLDRTTCPEAKKPGARQQKNPCEVTTFKESLNCLDFVY